MKVSSYKTILLAMGFSLVFFNFVLSQTNSPPKISNVTSVVSTSSIKFSWEAFDDDGLSLYSFSFGPTTDYGTLAKVSAKSLEGEDGTNYFLSTELTGLQPSSKHYYNILVKDTQNEVEAYAGSFVIPDPDNSAPIISRVSAVAQSTNATISWTTNEPASSEVKYWKSGDEPKNIKQNAFVSEHFVFLDELSPAEIYYFQVISSDASSNQSSSFEQNFKTSGSVAKPNDVSGLRVSAANNAFVLNWKNPNDLNFDGVRIVKKVGSASEFVSDGSTIYQGRGETYTDRSVVPEKYYFYTVYSYDQKNIYSGGALIEGYMGSGGNLVTSKPEVTVSISSRLSIENFRFSVSGKQIQAEENVISNNSGARLSINISSSLLPYIPETIFVKIDGQEIHRFSPPVEQNNYFTNFIFPSEGKHEAYIQVDYSNGKRDVVSFYLEGRGTLIEAPVIRTNTEKVIEFKPTPEPPKLKDDIKLVVGAAKTLKELTKTEEVKEVVSDVVAPAAVSAVAVGTFVTIPSWFSSLPLFHLLALQPFLVFGRRKRYGWGGVYNSVNKMPIDLAVVRLLNKENGRIVQSKVTDNEGRYAFVVNPGSYIIQVIKGKFIFPSAILNDVKNDGQKIDIYHGETIVVNETDGVVAPNIPIDPLGEFEKPNRIFWQKFVHKFQIILSWLSLIVTAISLYLSPKWYVWVLLGVNVLLLLVFRRIAKPPKIKSWGIVFDSKTKAPIDHAVVRLFNEQYNKLIATQITDNKGRYYFLAGDNKYYLTCEHPMYSVSKTSTINLSGTKAENITMDIGLKRLSK